MSQTRVKHLGAAKENKYRLLYKSQESRSAEMLRQKEKMHTLLAIVQKLQEDYPDIDSSLRPIAASIKSHAISDSFQAKEMVCS